MKSLLELTPAEALEEQQRRLARRAEGKPLVASAFAAVPDPAAPRVVVRAAHAAPISIGDPPLTRRVGDRLELWIPHPPRTKKNGKVNYATEKLAYRRYRAQVQDFLTPWRAQLGLPLPDHWYAVQCHFFTDGQQVDTAGLWQGLADALQDAGVVTNDRYLRRLRDVNWSHDPVRPRVEIILTPIAEAAPPCS